MTDKPGGHDTMTRRDAIFRVAAMLGGVALVGQAAMLAGGEARAANDTSPADAFFTEEEVELLDEIAETILPATSTPGARAAGVGPFIALMVADTYFDEDQAVFRAGLADLQARCRDRHGRQFGDAAPAERQSLLEAIDREQYDYMASRDDDAPAHYFRMMKELTLLGYFTSEVGYTQAMRYAETPGEFDPCVPLAPGDRTWAKHA